MSRLVTMKRVFAPRSVCSALTTTCRPRGQLPARVREVVEQALLGAAEAVQGRRRAHDRRGQRRKAPVGRQAQNVAHARLLAPAHDARAAEAAVAPQDDLNARPLGAQRVREQLEHRPRPPGRVPVARLQHRRQQVPAAEHVKGKVAVRPVVPVPVPPLLHPVQLDVGGVEVQHHPLRRNRVRRHELLEQHPVQRHRLRRRGPPLEPAQRRRAGHLPVPHRRRLQRRVQPQPFVVVEVLVAQDEAVDPLPEDVQRPVDHAFAPPVVADGIGRRPGQAHPAVGLRKQHGAAVRGDLRARELGLHGAPPGA